MSTKTENEIGHIIVDSSFKVHTSLGPGLLESVYEAILARELANRGLSVVRQFPVPIHYDGLYFDEGFKADLCVEKKVLVELKSIDAVAPVHKKTTPYLPPPFQQKTWPADQFWIDIDQRRNPSRGKRPFRITKKSFLVQRRKGAKKTKPYSSLRLSVFA